MKWIGLTGSIASGKTTAANIFKSLGVPVVDADQLAHQALRFHQAKIVTYFGPDILGDDGLIDRRKLGEKVFANAKLKKTLEAIIHPFVQEKVSKKKQLLEASGQKIAIYDVPLLFESNLQDQFEHILLVYVPESVSLKRLMDRNALTEEQAKQRLANQIDIEIKKDKADTLLDNQGDIESLKKQAIEWLAEFTQ